MRCYGSELLQIMVTGGERFIEVAKLIILGGQFSLCIFLLCKVGYDNTERRVVIHLEDIQESCTSIFLFPVVKRISDFTLAFQPFERRSLYSGRSSWKIKSKSNSPSPWVKAVG